MKKIIYIVLTLIFFVGIYYLVDFRKALELLRIGNLLLIVCAILIGVVNSYLIAMRIKTIFSVVKKLSVSYFWALSYVGSFISIIAPLSLGGFSMAYFLSKKAKVAYSKSLAMVLTDFLIGIAPIAFFVPIALWYFFKSWIFLLIYLVLMLSIPFLIKKIIIFKALILSVLIFIISNFQFYLFMLAFNLTPNFIDFILANSLLGALAFIPGAPGKIGQYEALGILTLPYLLKLDGSAIFTVMLTMRLASTFVILVLGYISFYFLDIKIKDLTKLTTPVSDFARSKLPNKI